MDLPTSIEAIVKRFQTGSRFRYVFFWGHTPSATGVVDKACLSQWYPSPFELAGVTYPTAEHYMMAEKARLFGDHDAARAAVAAPSPGAVKKIGRSVRGFVEEEWQSHRWDIVVRGNLGKFGQNETLRGFLLGTKARVLVEASPLDRVWGIGMAVDDPDVEDPTKWRGLNLLGFALMKARRLLEDEGPA